MSILYQLYIELTGSHSKVWRRLIVPADTYFDYLHDMIHIAMSGHADSEADSPYEFKVNGITIYNFGPELDMGDNPSERDAMDCPLDELVTKADTSFNYTWKDRWKCDIRVEKMVRSERSHGYLECTGGVGAGPGGAGNFSMKEVNAALSRYMGEWDETYGEEDNEEQSRKYEDVRHLKTPADVLNDELERRELECRVDNALSEGDNLEFDTSTRLNGMGHDQQASKAMILEALAVERLYELKYGAGHPDRFAHNLDRLPEAPVEIPSLDFAIDVLDKSTQGIPFAAIEYLYNDTSPEGTSAIVKALGNFSDHQYCWGNCQLAPIWYAMAAEGHLCEELIDPVVNLYLGDNVNGTDLLSEQGEYLIGKLAERYPDAVVPKVLAVLEKDAAERRDDSVYFLFDVFHFCDADKYKGRLIRLLKRQDVNWHNMMATTVAYLQIKEALPILKKQLDRITKVPAWYRGEVKEAIEQLETGVNLYPDVDMPRCVKRGDWKEEYANAEEYFYDSEPLPDDNDMRELSQFFGSEKESSVRQPQIGSPKVGRNDPCPCGSGKKYKKCCLEKDLFGDI